MRSADLWRQRRAAVIKRGASLTSLSPHTARITPPTHAEADVDMQQHRSCGPDCERRRIAAEALAPSTVA
jgi:hypothetical protein